MIALEFVLARANLCNLLQISAVAFTAPFRRKDFDALYLNRANRATRSSSGESEGLSGMRYSEFVLHRSFV
jgi:hypothetical protein